MDEVLKVYFLGQEQKFKNLILKSNFKKLLKKSKDSPATTARKIISFCNNPYDDKNQDIIAIILEILKFYLEDKVSISDKKLEELRTMSGFDDLAYVKNNKLKLRENWKEKVRENISFSISRLQVDLKNIPNKKDLILLISAASGDWLEWSNGKNNRIVDMLSTQIKL